MSCWAVPSVAAELWGCTLDSVLKAIHNGDVRTYQEAGWTFVDVAPDEESSQDAATETCPPLAQAA